jgi:hypothetical protein
MQADIVPPMELSYVVVIEAAAAVAGRMHQAN